MNSLSIAVVGPYKSGKSTLVNKLQQRKGVEEDVSFYSFKYGGKSITLIDTPGDVDTPALVTSVLSISDAVMFCISPDVGINFQVGEIAILINTVGIKNGLVCITKSDISTEVELDKLKQNLATLFKNTVLENFEIITVNSNDDQNIADVRAKLSMLPYDQELINKPFRLCIDYAFESKGMSVAVGTLKTGKISVHSEGIITPTPFIKEISINSIQVNQEDVQTAEAGDRIGVSIKGVWPWDLPRGVEIREKGKFKDIKDYINSSEFALIKNQINSNISSYCANGKHEKCPGHFLSNKNIKCECECHKK